MTKTYIIIGGISLLLLISITVKDNSNKDKAIQTTNSKEIAIKSIESISIKCDEIPTKETVQKTVSLQKVQAIKESKSLNFQEKLLNQLDSILANKTKDTSFIITNISKIFQCKECLDKLRTLLVSSEVDKTIVEIVANSIGSTNTKEGAKLLLEAMRLNIESENQRNIELIESSFSNFDSVEVATLFASVLFETSDNQIVSSSSLSENTQYAMQKVINNTSERDLVASNLADIYNSAVEDEQKEKIVNLRHPEMYAIIALDAYNQGDSELYDSMVENLIKTPKEESINALMLLARKSESDSMNDITEVATKWSQNNTSKRNIEIAEDYLSKSDTTPKERIIASALLTSSPNGSKALDKALNHEEDGDVVAYLGDLTTEK